MTKLATTTMGLLMLALGAGCGASAQRGAERVDATSFRATSVAQGEDCMPGEYAVSFTPGASPVVTKATSNVALRPEVASKRGSLRLGTVEGLAE